MDKEIKQFIREAKNTKLSDQERNLVKNNILNFISNNPVRPDIGTRLNYGSNIFLTKLNFTTTMAIFLILTVLVSGGMAVGAEKALPGDILYPIKVSINEEVRGWIAASEESKADWEIRRTERRLEEAEELAGEGTLDAEVSQKIEANFDAHVQRVKDRVEKFRSKENFNAAASVSLNFETALKAHDKILSKLADRKDESGERVKPIRSKVRSKVIESAHERKQMDVQLKARTEGSVEIDNSEKDDHTDSPRIKEEMKLELDTDLKLEL